MEFTPEGKICSFCGSTWRDDNRFAGVFGAMICHACIDRYHEMFSDREELLRRTRPPWNEMSDEELLDTLPHIVKTTDQVEEFLYGWVDLLRDRRVSWQAIGLALGVSRQAAWERFTRVKRSMRRVPGQG